MPRQLLLLFAAAVTITTVTCQLGDYCEGCLKVKCVVEPNRKPPTHKTLPISGHVTLTQRAMGQATFINVRLRGVPPLTVHGFHIHKSGDIITKGCQSAKGHFNPYGKTHAGPRKRDRHVGDLGNVWSDYHGNVRTSFFDHMVSLYGPDSVIGRSIVLHAERDDLGRGIGEYRTGSLATGNAGARLACCVIVHV